MPVTQLRDQREFTNSQRGNPAGRPAPSSRSGAVRYSTCASSTMSRRVVAWAVPDRLAPSAGSVFASVVTCLMSGSIEYPVGIGEPGSGLDNPVPRFPMLKRSGRPSISLGLAGHVDRRWSASTSAACRDRNDGRSARSRRRPARRPRRPAGPIRAFARPARGSSSRWRRTGQRTLRDCPAHSGAEGEPTGPAGEQRSRGQNRPICRAADRQQSSCSPSMAGRAE